MCPTVSSVHQPSALETISIKRKGHVISYTMEEIRDAAKDKGISFVEAFNSIISEAYNKKG